MKNLIIVKCENCQEEFGKKTCKVAKCKTHFCSVGCHKEFREKHSGVIVECGNCHKKFKKESAQIAQTNANYCSRSCAAIVNNKLHPKRRKEQKFCSVCNEPIEKKRCKKCNPVKKSSSFGDRTLKEVVEVKQKQQSNRYNQIREHSRKVAKQFIEQNNIKYACVLCGYNKFVDACHIIDICDFSENTLVSEINSLSNLTILCPNHHKEFDNNLLEIIPPSLSSLSNGPKIEISKNNLKIKEDKIILNNYCCDCGNKIGRKATRCELCNDKNKEKITWPPTIELLRLLEENNNSYSTVGRMLGIGGNAIKKRIKNHPV